MKKDRSIKGFRLFILIALIVSLVINVMVISKITSMEEDIRFLTDNQSMISNNVNSQSDVIRQELEHFIEEQSWISPITMERNEKQLANGSTDVTFSWQLQEFHQDAKVMFHYKYGETNEFTEIPANEEDTGMFQVQIPFEMDLKPEWQVSTRESTKSSNQVEDSERATDTVEDDKENHIYYFVSVSHEGLIKQSEQQSEQLDYLGMNNYGSLFTDIHLNEDEVRLHVYYHNIDNQENIVEEVNLLKYQHDTLMEEEQLTLQDEGMRDRPFNLEPFEQYDNMRLVIEVEYTDGTVLDKQVYPNEVK